MIAVVRAGALGDTVLTLPAIAWLRQRFPASPLEVIGYPAIWEITGKQVDEVRSIERPPFSGLFAGLPSPALREWAGALDLLVVWSARDPRPAIGEGSLPLIQASPYPPPGCHAATWLLETVGGPAGQPENSGNLLGLSADERQAGTRFLREQGLIRPIILHPGAGAVWKRWPAPQFARLAQDLRRQGRHALLLEGPADQGVVAEVQERVVEELPVLRGVPPRPLAAILAGAAAFVGNDSGATHLASMAGVPTVALFGPTDPVSWAPLGTVRILRQCTTTPSRQGQVRVCEDPGCMEGIRVDDVLAAIKSFLWV